jgi:hypothetical protein
MVRTAPRERINASFFDNLARSRRAQPDGNFVPSEQGSYFDGPRHVRRVPCPKTCYDPSAGAPRPQHVRQPSTKAPTVSVEAATALPTPRRSSRPRSPTRFDDVEAAGLAARWIACDSEFPCIQKRKGARRWRARLPKIMQDKYHRHAHFSRLRDARRFAHTFVHTHGRTRARRSNSPPTDLPCPSEDTDATDDDVLSDASGVLLDLTAPEGGALTSNDAFGEPAWENEPLVDDLSTVAALLGMDVDCEATQCTFGSDGSFVDCALDDRYAMLFAHETLENDNPLSESSYGDSSVKTHRFRLSDYANLYSGDVLVAHGRRVAGPTPRLRPCSTWKRGCLTTRTTWGERDGPFFVPLWVRQLETMKNAQRRDHERRRRRVLWADLDDTTPLA